MRLALDGLSSAFVCWIGLALLLGAWSPPGPDGGAARSEERMLVLSRHSGEVLAGKDFAVHALEGSDARALADLARIESAAGRSPSRSAADLVVRLDDDRVIVNDPRTAVPPAARGDSAAEVQVFGLVGPEQVSVRCAGRAVRVEG
ncbi:MAG TPA: hypothetical protein VGI39_38585, partial [Polyangiaceae bacterium]